VTVAGTYHPATSPPSFVEPNGMGITNSINRTELAAITAAILHCHSHIATDSLSSLHLIRKHLLYPELHRHHVQGVILKIPASATHQTLCTYSKSNFTLVISVRMLWPSTKQPSEASRRKSCRCRNAMRWHKW